MRFALLLLVLVSCGKVEQVPTDRLDPLPLQPTALTAEERQKISAVCQTLAAMDIEGLVNNDYKYTLAEKGCKDDAVGSPKGVTVTVIRNAEGYKLMDKESGRYFYFSDVEQASQGVMQPLCQTEGGLSSPMKLESGRYLYFGIDGIKDVDCPSKANEQCVYFARGIPDSSGKNAVVMAREWVRFRLNSAEDQRGFVTYRKLITKSDCVDGATSIRVAELNGAKVD